MAVKSYDPREYWGTLVAGSGDLANVGQPLLGPYNNYTYRFRLAALRKALGRAGVALEQARVFEAAYGEGFYLAFWESQGVRSVDGLDISASACQSARARFPSFHLRCGDLTRREDFAPFGHYPVVTAIDVLYHIVDDRLWRDALHNLLDLVEGGGVFLFTDKFTDGSPSQRFAHVRRRPLPMWQDALGDKGFRVRHIVPVFVFMDDPVTTGNHPLLGHVSALQWRVLGKAIRVAAVRPRWQRWVATLAAGLQYAPEKALLSVLRRTPNLELCVCQK
jgi:hypothetical protein